MDWRAMAASLAEEVGRPVLALDPDGRIRLVNHAAEDLLGGKAEDIVARSIGDLWVDPKASCLHEALQGTARGVEGEVVALDGRRLRVRAVVAVVLSEGCVSSVLIQIQSALAVSSTPAAGSRNLDYSVSLDARDFGAVVRLPGAFTSEAPSARRRCWELFGRREICPDCPLRREDAPWPRTLVRRRPGAHGALELVQAYLESPLIASVTVRQIDDATFTTLFEARLAGMGEDAGLSAREAAVFRYLVMGRALDDIGTILEISKRTVKHHQANLLRKLGADSRADLIRLVM